MEPENFVVSLWMFFSIINVFVFLHWTWDHLSAGYPIKVKDLIALAAMCFVGITAGPLLTFGLVMYSLDKSGFWGEVSEKISKVGEFEITKGKK